MRWGPVMNIKKQGEFTLKPQAQKNKNDDRK